MKPIVLLWVWLGWAVLAGAQGPAASEVDKVQGGAVSASDAGPAGASTPEIRVELATPAFFYTHNLGGGGGNFAGETRVVIRLMNSVNAAPPIVVRTTLPAGITFVNSSGSGWNCTATGQDLACTSMVGLLTTARWRAVDIRVNVAGDIPVPGSSTVRVLREHATLPPPDPTNCQSIPSGAIVYSDTGCVEDVVEHRQSRIWFEPTGWSHSPNVFLAGSTENRIETLVRSVGFHSPHQPIVARFLFPPGIIFNRAVGSTWGCTAEAPVTVGQWVNCTYFGNFVITTGPAFRVDVASNVPVPGPVVIVAHVGNSFQPAPADIADCLEPDPPEGCSSYSIPTGTPPQARMEFIEISPDPDAFRPGDSGRVFIRYENMGVATSGPVSIDFAAPPGFEFIQTLGANPALGCTASGDPEAGQTINCSGASGIGVGQTGQFSLDFEVEWAGSLLVPILGSIGDTTRPDPGLVVCEPDPEQSGCGIAELPILDALYCDRFENPSSGCRRLP